MKPHPYATAGAFKTGLEERIKREAVRRGCDVQRPRQLLVFDRFLTRTFGACEQLLSFDTFQFDDYARYVAPRFDPKKKAERRRDVFPEDCRRAFELGARLVQGVRNASKNSGDAGMVTDFSKKGQRVTGQTSPTNERS